jgi:hypothetical protein
MVCGKLINFDFIDKNEGFDARMQLNVNIAVQMSGKAFVL